MVTSQLRLLMTVFMSFVTLALGACAPARHSTTVMANERVLSELSPIPAADDWELPDDDSDNNMNSTPVEPVKIGNSMGRQPAAWDGHTDQAADFTAITQKALDALGSDLINLVPSDMATFCPKYASLSYEARKGVWLMIISAMVQFESEFKPAAAYQEKFKNSQNELVVSRGLLQLSTESANGYGCHILRDSDLNDPMKNLACGVRILNRNITRDSVITAHDDHWHGGARYWAVLRKPKYLEPIRTATRSLASCG